MKKEIELLQNKIDCFINDIETNMNRSDISGETYKAYRKGYDMLFDIQDNLDDIKSNI